MSVQQERSKQETKIYSRLLIILNAKTHAKGNGARTLSEYMPEHSSYIHNTPDSISILKISLVYVSTTRKKWTRNKNLFSTCHYTKCKGACKSVGR